MPLLASPRWLAERVNAVRMRREILPFDMFGVQYDADAARRADRLTSIYHRGQDLAWRGHEVLNALLRKHGGVQLRPEARPALGYVLGVLMWGELAAWKIAAQLADSLVELPPKLAATSQAHDEARHFYVLHDYLKELGYTPPPLDRQTRMLLSAALRTRDPVKKVMGMQLMIEALALTIFQALRESAVEPVAAELLRYFEKDEARHVGLGMQYLPAQLRRLSRRRSAELLAFQIELTVAALLELKAMEPHLRVLGISARQVFLLGTTKQALALDLLWQEDGGRSQGLYPTFGRLLAALGQLLFPDAVPGQGSLRRTAAAVQAAVRTFRSGLSGEVPESSIDPDAPAVRPSAIW